MIKEQNQKKINARVMKWLQMLKKGLEKDKDVLIRRTRKGIPPAIRIKIWPQLIKIDKIIQKSTLTYSTLLLKDSYDAYDINLDIPRTFTFQSQEVLRDSLFNVLKSLSIQFPLIGYCQGMNFLCMRLLEILDDSTVFYLISTIIKKYKSLYDNFRNPGFVNRQNRVFSTLLEKFMPKVFKKLKQQSIEPVMYTTSWFLTLFSKVIEKEKFYRFFQCFLVEGYTIIYKAALTLIKLKQKQILSQQMQENLMFVSNFEFYSRYTPDQFINTVYSFNFTLQEIYDEEKKYSLKHKTNFKQLEESVQKTYNRKIQEPRSAVEWSIEDFKKSDFEIVDFQ